MKDFIKTTGRFVKKMVTVMVGLLIALIAVRLILFMAFDVPLPILP